MPRLRAAVGAALALWLAAPAAQAHTFDLAQHMPPHLAIMFAMAWFGVKSSDPQPGGTDPGWGNWRAEFPQCGLANDPSTCEDLQGAGLQRSIGSKRRPLAGIYSSSGQTDESRARIDLMLSTLRRPCDAGARLDAFAIQLDSIKFTSAHPQNQQSATWDLAYRAQVAFLERADSAGLASSVMVANDSTVYWHFGDNFGLTTQAQRLAALTDDVVEMATLADGHASAVKIAGRPLLLFYVDAPLVTAAEWSAVLDGARAQSGVDFYALGSTLKSAMYAAFDALVPWVNLGMWQDTATGASVHDHAVAWQAQQHAELIAGVGAYPGRVVFGAVTPGFDDYTMDWGACMPREIPREPAVLDGQFDWLESLPASGPEVHGLLFETWDDWTEGTELEPDVVEGPAKLVQARQRLGKLFGDPVDAAGDVALASRWTSYGQARNCCFAGGDCPDAGAPKIDLSCPPPLDGGAGGAGGASSSSGAMSSSSSGGASGPKGAGGSPAAPQDPGGCGCRVGRTPGADLTALLLALVGLAFARRRAFS